MRRHWASTRLNSAVTGAAYLVPLVLCLNLTIHAWTWKIFTLTFDDHGPSEDFGALLATHVELAVLGLAWIVWSILLVRGHVSVASGGGLALAAYGLALRAASDLAA